MLNSGRNKRKENVEIEGDGGVGLHICSWETT